MRRNLYNYPVIAALIAAFLLNAVAPVLASPSQGDKVLICSAQGYQWVNLADVGVTETEPDTVRCVLCLPANDQFDLDGIDAIVVDVSTPQRYAQKVSSDFIFFKARFLTLLRQSRAPPLA